MLNTNLFKLFTGSIFSSFAQNMSFVITGSLTYQLTRSEFYSSISWAGNAVGQIMAFPIAMLISDKFPKNKNMFFSFTFAAFTALIFAILLQFDLYNIGTIISYVALLGTSQFTAHISAMAILPNLVSNEQTQSAFGLIAFAYFLTSTLAPLFTGNLIDKFGSAIPTFTKSILLIIAAFISHSIKDPNYQKPAISNTLKESIQIGFSLIKQNPNVLNLFVLHWLFNSLAVPGIHGLIPVFSEEKLGMGASGVGILFAAIGVGGMISTIGLFIYGNQLQNRMRIVLTCGLLTGLSMILFALINLKIVNILLLVFFNFNLITILTLRLGLFAQHIPKDQLGRIFAINFLTSATSIIGSTIIGIIAKNYGAEIATTISGSVILVVLIFMSFFVRSFRENIT